jgi:hypothetical protein
MLVAAQIFPSLSRAGGDSPPLVLFDEGHGQPSLIDGTDGQHLSGLAGAIRAAGAYVTQVTATLEFSTIRDATALVISGPVKPLRPEEAAAVIRYLANGGKVAIMMQTGQPLDTLLERLGVDYSTALLHERENVIDRDVNFRLTDLTPGPLFSGIDSFSVYGAWALRPGTASAGIARTSSRAWVDLNGTGVVTRPDARGIFPVAVAGKVGKGEFVLFGDDAIFQNAFLVGNNLKLAENLAQWLLQRH